jgi:uncharacterized membrane-anchored protein
MRLALLLGSLTLLAPVAAAQEADSSDTITAEQFLAELHPRQGVITLQGGIATLSVPDAFRYLDSAGARRLLVAGWGNPPQSADGVLGMLIPGTVNPLTPDGWGVVITFDADGYVDDADAEKIDYAKMMTDMRSGEESDNAERAKAGYPPIHLVGWATPPRYNRDTHKLYWAKELAFGSDSVHTLNYNVRILGRRGVLVLNAVAGMDQLPAIERDMQTVIGFVDFNQGHRYADFVPGADKKAAYGIGGLILGAAAAKAGLFKLLWVGILGLKKFIIAGLAAAGVALRRLFGKKQQPQPPSAPA